MEDKFDIIKDFGTLELFFSTRSLRAFGFDGKFVDWIHEILKSARLSIFLNGSPYGYIECERGVR